MALLGSFGINATLLRFLPVSKNPNQELGAALLVSFVGTSALAIGYIALLPHIAPRLLFVHSSLEFSALFVLLTVFGSLNNITDAVFLARQQSKYIFLSDGIVQGAAKLLALWTVLGLGTFSEFRALGIYSAIGAAAIADVLVSMWFIIYRLNYRPSLRLKRRSFTSSPRYTLILYLVNILDVLPTLSLPTIILDGLDSRNAGYFYIAFQVGGILSGVGVSIALSAMTEGIQGGADLRDVVRRTRRILMTTVVPVTFVGLLLAPWGLKIFGGTYNEHARNTLEVLVLAVPMVTLCQWTRSLLQITKQLRALLISQSLYAIVVIFLSIALVRFGIIWVAVAYLLGNAVAAGAAGLPFYTSFGKASQRADGQALEGP